MMKTFLKRVGVGPSRQKYAVEILDGLFLGSFHEKYFEEDLRKALDKKKKEQGKTKLLLVDAGATPWMVSIFNDTEEVECMPIHLGPFHHIPSLNAIFEVIADMHAWMQSASKEGDRHVIVIVASSVSSEVRPLLPGATLLTCYLDYLDLHATVGKSLEYIRKKISEHDLVGREQLKTRVEVTSSLYYLNLFHSISTTGAIANGMPLVLTKIKISGGISLPGHQRWHPIIHLHTYALSEPSRQNEYERITLGGPGDEENATIADSYSIFNVNVLTYGDFMLTFDHWIPLINQSQPMFSISRNTVSLAPPEQVVEIEGLEIAAGQSRGLDFDKNFCIRMFFEPVDIESGDFADEEILMMDRVEQQLASIEEIAPLSRRASKYRASEAAKRRNNLQTALPEGDGQSIGLGLNNAYPQKELTGALDALPVEEIDGFLNAFKTFQMLSTRKDRTDDVAQLLAESGFVMDDGGLMIDQDVQDDDDEYIGDLDISLDDLNVVSDEDDEVEDHKDANGKPGDETDETGSSSETESEDDDAEDGSGGEEASVDEEQDREHMVNDFIWGTLTRVAADKKIDLTDPSISWLEIAGTVHGELMGSSNRVCVEAYSASYKKPVTLARQLRRLNRDFQHQSSASTAHSGNQENIDSDLNLPPPAPMMPEMPSMLEGGWDLELPDIGDTATITRRPSWKKPKAPRPKAAGAPLTLRRSIKPEKKELRPLHWNKISDKVVDKTAFAMAAPKKELFEQLMEDTKEIDNLFATTTKAPLEDLVPQVKSAGVLEAKRQMNFDIMLSKFPSELSAIFQALQFLDPQGKVLSDEQVQILESKPITGEELNLAFQFKGGDSELVQFSRAEQFVILASRCPLYTAKVRAANTVRTYSSLVEDLEEGASNLLKASSEIKNSQSFKDFIAVVLSMGNFLNEGTRKGDARGFRLETLPKLADVRSKEKNLSLLHYVIQVAKQRDEKAIRFVDEFQHLKLAMRNSKDELNAMGGALNKSVKDCQSTLEKLLKEANQSLSKFEARKPKPEDSDLVASSVLFWSAKKGTERVCKMTEKAVSDFEDLAGFLGENAKRAKIEDLFGVLKNFCDLVTKCDKELEDREEEAKKKRGPLTQ